MITIEDVHKLDIRMGTIMSASFVPGADKLICFSVDLGEESPRQILSGVRQYFPNPEMLIGLSVPVVANLTPRTIRGMESQGMILYVVDDATGEHFTALTPLTPVPPGQQVR